MSVDAYIAARKAYDDQIKAVEILALKVSSTLISFKQGIAPKEWPTREDMIAATSKLHAVQGEMLRCWKLVPPESRKHVSAPPGTEDARLGR